MSTGAICYEKPNEFTVGMGVVLMAGTFVSYVPWAVNVWQARTRPAELLTIAPGTLALGLFSSTINLVNAAILNWEKIICCKTNSELVRLLPRAPLPYI